MAKIVGYIFVTFKTTSFPVISLCLLFFQISCFAYFYCDGTNLR